VWGKEKKFGSLLGIDSSFGGVRLPGSMLSLRIGVCDCYEVEVIEETQMLGRWRDGANQTAVHHLFASAWRIES